jgi:hypothetical protein
MNQKDEFLNANLAWCNSCEEKRLVLGTLTSEALVLRGAHFPAKNHPFAGAQDQVSSHDLPCQHGKIGWNEPYKGFEENHIGLVVADG